MKKGWEVKTKFSKTLPNNQIITAYRIELQVQEMTMDEKLTMIGLTILIRTHNHEVRKQTLNHLAKVGQYYESSYECFQVK